VERATGKMGQTKDTACAKALRQGQAWYVGGSLRRPMWLEHREQGGGREGTGQVVQDPVNCGKEFVLDQMWQETARDYMNED
jgi:hypothetical protein